MRKVSEPLILKESSTLDTQLRSLENMRGYVSNDSASFLENDIKLMSFGSVGEKSLMYELKSSDMPICVIRDLHLKHGDLTAQIDFVVITRGTIYLLECKNLSGNIEVRHNGEFIRKYKYDGRTVTESLYSPITQNARHLSIFKKCLSKKLSLKDRLFNRYKIKPLVVLANSRSVLNTLETTKSLMNQITKIDLINKRISEGSKYKPELSRSQFKKVKRMSLKVLSMHDLISTDISSKYKRYSKDKETQLFDELRAYRAKKTKEEQTKAYYIFTNRELEDVVSNKPRTVDDLKTIYGFGSKKIEAYGDDIISIVSGVCG
jgi:hypothetical protein